MAIQKHILLATSVLFLLLLVAAATMQPMRAKAAAQAAAATRAATKSSGITFERDVAPLIKTYCVTCHTGSEPPGGISLAGYKTAASVLQNRSVWEKVSENVSSARMPPEGAPHPAQAERERIANWIDSTLSQADCQLHDPGRVTLRRLNREEYNNTVHDLTGITFRPADDFPSDDVGYGFDNIGDVLSMSPLLMEKYLNAAETIVKAAIITPESRRTAVHFTSDQLTSSEKGFTPAGDRLLRSTADAGVIYNFTESGEYILRARAYGEQAGPDPARMSFILDAKPIKIVDVKAVEAAPGVYEVRAHIDAGSHQVAVGFTNDYYNPLDPGPKDRNLVVNRLAIEGPLGALRGTSSSRIITARPANAAQWDSCARAVMTAFARRAYRRPVTANEVARLVRCVDAARTRGASFERGIQLAVEAVLVSPNFLFRVEADPQSAGARAPRTLSSYELATRLSYFLWSSMPDDELFALAAKDALHNPKVLEAQVRRMLKDPKAGTLASNFAGQWLQLRKLRTVAPDPGRFKDFDENLRAAMRTETEMFFTGIMREDRSVLEFLDSKYTYLNEPLARHYGIDGVSGPEFRRVMLTGDQRGGVLTQASVLTVTSNPTRTSPVKRGRWVLEQILGTPPPPPPPGVAQLPDDSGKKTVLTGTLRERMIQHRKDPACAACHMRMDPLGFGLENYDAVGAWRTSDGGQPIDSSGTLPTGEKFSNPAELKTYLISKKGQFVHALSEKMLTFALGRGLEPTDRCAIDAISQKVAKHGYRFSALVTAAVESDPFRLRRGEAPVKKTGNF